MRHILLGDIMLSKNSVPHTNLLSYTFPSFPFINTTWLYEVMVYEAVKNFGLNFLLVLTTLIVFLSSIFEFRYVFQRFGKPAVLYASYVYLFLLSLRTDVRPEVFSMVFLSLFIIILYRYFEKPTRLIYALIPLEILWVNMHIYFIAGPLLILLFLLGKRKDKKIRNTKFVIKVFIAVLFVTLINPNFINGAIYPLTFFFNYGFPVVENQTALVLFSIYKNASILLPAIIVCAVCFFAIVKRKNHTTELLLVLFFGGLTLLNFRNILLFIFATYVPFVIFLNAFLREYKKKIAVLPKITIPLIAFFSLFILSVSIVKSFQIRGFGLGVREYWKGSIDFLIQNSIKGPYYNDFNIGGYLSYWIYPAKVFVDNRPEAYPKSFFEKVYLPMQKNPEIFNVIDKKYQFNALVVSHYDTTTYKNKLLQHFLISDKYSLVYIDDFAMVFVKNSNQNRKIIDEKRITKNEITFDRILDRNTLLRYLLLFEKVGWDDKSVEIVKRLKTLNALH